MQKLRINDEVMVMAGKDKGKTGKITTLLPKRSRVIVAGVNVLKKAVKPTQENPNGGITEVEASVHRSNVMVVSPKDGKPSRVRIEEKDGKKVRVAVSCGSVLE